jgi:hypothetical protein
MAIQGHDNTTFQLGTNFIISFPNKDMYQESIQSVYDFLPKIQEYLSIKIPIKMHIGNPSTLFPYRWSIQTYIYWRRAELYSKIVDYDHNTWIRVMAWTLWKGLLEISQISKSNANDWKNPQKVIEEIIENYKNNYT